MDLFLLFMIEILAVMMLLLALRITTASTVHAMIPSYQLQSLALIVITLVTALETAGTTNLVTSVVIGAFMLIPSALIFLIEPLLAQATIFEPAPAQERLKRLLSLAKRRETLRQAVPIWLQARRPGSSLLGTIVYDLLVVVVAFVIAFRFNMMSALRSDFATQFPSVVMAVALSLLLIGITIMIRKDDILSQVIGLLVMEHGMFLGALRLISDPSIKVMFVMGLFVYTVITLLILVVLLPELHQASGTIDTRQQNQLKG